MSIIIYSISLFYDYILYLYNTYYVIGYIIVCSIGYAYYYYNHIAKVSFNYV